MQLFIILNYSFYLNVTFFLEIYPNATVFLTVKLIEYIML